MLISYDYSTTNNNGFLHNLAGKIITISRFNLDDVIATICGDPNVENFNLSLSFYTMVIMVISPPWS